MIRWLGVSVRRWYHWIACRAGRCVECRLHDTPEGVGGKCVRCGRIHGWMTREELRELPTPRTRPPGDAS